MICYKQSQKANSQGGVDVLVEPTFPNDKIETITFYGITVTRILRYKIVNVPAIGKDILYYNNKYHYSYLSGSYNVCTPVYSIEVKMPSLIYCPYYFYYGSKYCGGGSSQYLSEYYECLKPLFVAGLHYVRGKPIKHKYEEPVIIHYGIYTIYRNKHIISYEEPTYHFESDFYGKRFSYPY